MKYIKALVSSVLIFVAGWLFNFLVDIQFALGLVAGWFLRKGYDNLAGLIFDLISQRDEQTPQIASVCVLAQCSTSCGSFFPLGITASIGSPLEVSNSIR